MWTTRRGVYLGAVALALTCIAVEAQPDVLHPQWLKQSKAQAKTRLEYSECLWTREVMRPRAGGR